MNVRSVTLVLLVGVIGAYATIAPRATRSTRACAVDSACSAREVCVDRGCRAIERAAAACSNAKVHFVAQSTDVETADVERILRCLHDDRAVTFQLAGSSDPVLSAERASVVAEELMARGASPAELQTVRYGDNRRLCDTRCPN